jgi:DNA invertase Pin-like site-specific DNA recombinase
MPNQKTRKIPKTVVGYTRVSTDEQAKEGISLPAQAEKIKAFATLKDMQLVDIISDEGVSGKDLQRPGLTKLLDLVLDGKADAIVVYKLDRLSRRTRDLLFLIEDLFKKAHIRFFSLTEQIDTETAIGKFFLTLMGAMAQMERELIAERTKATLAYKKELGEYLGHVPYGYQVRNEKLVNNEKEQQVILEMKRLKKYGFSYRKIATLLNNQGIPTRSKGTKWYDSSVWYVLNGTKQFQRQKA